MAKLEELQLMENTAIFFAGDNGPDMFKQQSGGSEGLFTGRAAGYWNTGKGSTTPYNCSFAHVFVLTALRSEL